MVGRLSRIVEQTREALRAAAPAVTASTGKSRLRQGAELLYWRVKGFSPDDYYMLRLYEEAAEDNHAPMSRRDFTRLRRELNPGHSGVVPFDKWVSCVYFEALGIRVPHCHGIYDPERGASRDGKPLTSLTHLAALLARIPGGVVMKPLDGSHGFGVSVIASFDAARNVIRRGSGREQSLEEFAAPLRSYSQGWVVQERIVQHAALAKLHPTAVNTVRMVTLCSATNVEVIGAVLRLGVGTSEIDNTTGGGIVAPLDLASGRCGAAIERYRVAEHRRHPSTNAEIIGFEVPHWTTVQEAAVRAHRLLPFPKTLGWDIAIEDRGPVILEVNSDYYHNHLQLEGPSAALESLRRSGMAEDSTQTGTESLASPA